MGTGSGLGDSGMAGTFERWRRWIRGPEPRSPQLRSRGGSHMPVFTRGPGANGGCDACPSSFPCSSRTRRAHRQRGKEQWPRGPG